MSRDRINGLSRRHWILSLGNTLLLHPKGAAASPQPPADAFDKRSKWITDLSKCRPAAAISRQAAKAHWRLIDYEALGPSGTLKGSMLACGPETAPPPVSVSLNATGWHAIYIGLKPYLGIGEPNTIKVKLKSDPCFVLRAVETVTGGVRGEDIGLRGDAEVERGRRKRREIQDCFYKYANLTNEELQFSALTSGVAETCALAYVRLVPLSEAEVAAIHQQIPKRQDRRLACMNDNITFMHFRRPTTKEEIWEEIYPYKDTDYKAIYWTAARGDNCLYPTKVGTVMGEGVTDFPRVGDRYIAESLRTLLEKKIDPVQTAMDFTRRLGIEFHLCMRVEAFTAEAPWDGFFHSKFFFEHPELWCVDHDGRKIARLSYAFPESQRHLLALIRELAEYKPDGIMLMFPRAQPYVLYERPVADQFKKRYGEDCMKTGERDPRLLQVRADFVTEFMRQARREIEAIKAPHRIEFSATVLANEETNRFHALDPATWAAEKIIDRLSPSPFSTIRSQANIDIEYFARITRGTSCRLSPTMRPSWLNFPEVLPLARTFYKAGASELIVFDVNLHHQNPTEWRLWQALGRREELSEIEKRLKFDIATIEIIKLDNIVIDKYPPLWAF